MDIFRRLFNFYLQGSIHVALSVYCLIRVTELVLGLNGNLYVQGFGFFGTIVGYNFVKYDAVARSGAPKLSRWVKSIIALSLVTFIGTVFCFLQLRLMTQIVSLIFLVITALYTLPFFPNHSNARSWAGLKIYMVAFCWVGVTVVLPVINAGAPFNADFYIVSLKRFVLIVVLLFIFEIIDLEWDDPHLKTVPQQMGVKTTKLLGILLLLLFLAFELLRFKENFDRFISSIFVVFLTAAFLIFANQQRSKRYSAFWAESIPMLWWLLLYSEVLINN